MTSALMTLQEQVQIHQKVFSDTELLQEYAITSKLERQQLEQEKQFFQDSDVSAQ